VPTQHDGVDFSESFLQRSALTPLMLLRAKLTNTHLAPADVALTQLQALLQTRAPAHASATPLPSVGDEVVQQVLKEIQRATGDSNVPRGPGLQWSTHVSDVKNAECVTTDVCSLVRRLTKGKVDLSNQRAYSKALVRIICDHRRRITHRPRRVTSWHAQPTPSDASATAVAHTSDSDADAQQAYTASAMSTQGDYYDGYDHGFRRGMTTTNEAALSSAASCASLSDFSTQADEGELSDGINDLQQ
jgi:hypothetical protein